MILFSVFGGPKPTLFTLYANPALFIINRLAKMLDLTDRRMLYYGLIHPFLTYGIVVKEFLSFKKGR
jgi:hypothetical protein